MNPTAEAATRLPPHLTPNPKGPPSDKVAKFGWIVLDKPGEFQWIPKLILHVDHDYQRSNIHNSRILRITAEWSWVACGTLSVARRYDGTLWVMDGQHRKLAADKRSDIEKLPCMVYEVDGRVAEAKGFLQINTHRGSVKTIDKFNSLVMAGDPVAVAVKQMVEADGYTVSASAGSDSSFKVKCVGALCRCMKIDPAAARVAWTISTLLYCGRLMTDEFYEAVFTAERHMRRNDLGSLWDAHNRESLQRVGDKGIVRSISESKAYNGGGPKAGGEGVLRAINRGRSRRRIPGLYAVEDGPGDGTNGTPE